MMLNSIKECCTYFSGMLPDSQLPFIPALLVGIVLSVIILILLYKKRYNRKTLWECFKCMLRDIFITIPGTNHCEFTKCNISTCERCKREEKLWSLIVNRWKDIKNVNKETEYPRVLDAIRKINLNEKNKDVSIDGDIPSMKDKQLTSFEMDVPSNVFWSPFECFEVEKELLKINFKIITKEFEAIFKDFQLGIIDGFNLNHVPSGHWCVYPIIEQGVVNEENIQKCPNTSALIGSFPSLMKDCIFGNVFFSLLYPDSLIERHRGPTNIRLRCHFGLDIPEGCYLEVDGTQVKWKNDGCIIFDDSHEHSEYFAVNESFEKPRVILVVDFWHPSISKEEKGILSSLLKPGSF